MNRSAQPRGGYTPHVPRKTTRLPWLPRFIQHALAAHMRKMVGIVFFGICVGLLLLLLSYTASDPSLNSSSSLNHPPRNWLGLAGSYIADFLIQLFGAASYLLCLIWGAWGWRMVSEQGLDHLRGRIAMGLMGILGAAIALHAASLTETLSGGAFGQLLADKALQLLPRSFAAFVVTLFALIFSGATLFMACALSLAEWSRAWQLISGTIIGVVLWFWRKIAAILPEAWRAPKDMRQDEDIERDDTVSSEDETDAEEQMDEDLAADDDEPVQKARPKAARKVTVKKPPASRQARLAFGGEEESFALPPLDLLAKAEPTKAGRDIAPEMLQKNATLLEGVLGDFGIQGQITHVSPGPVVTLYELEPAPGIRAARVIALADDIARSMSVRSVRVAVVPGRNVIGIEMPNQKRETVPMRELLESDAYVNAPQALPLVLGKDIAGLPVIADLARMPHLLVAGTTGSGKSVSINTMILSLLYRLPPERCRFIMIDPKMLELSVYEGIPHLLAPVVTEPKKAIVALKWTVREMEERYRAMSKLGVRNIDGYNMRLKQARENGEELTRQVQTGFDPETGKPVFEEQPLDLTALPYIVVIVDEMADLMLVAGKDIEVAVQRLAQMARAAGIHIVMATQRPSVDVITGTIKANFPTRISFQVTSKIDSRTILGEMGAEQLLGQGDMLYMAGGGRITRVHGPFVRDSEVESIVAYLREQGTPDYLSEVTEEADSDGGMGDGMGDPNGEVGNALYDMAVDIVQREGKASTSFLQRHLKIGYNRAATLIEQMEREGVVSSANHVGKREVFSSRS